jgi:hypothetical protein
VIPLHDTVALLGAYLLVGLPVTWLLWGRR